MQYFLLGLLVLLVLLLLLRGFTVVDIATLARRLRVTGGLLALGGALVLTIRGMIGWAFPLATLGIYLMFGGGMPSWRGLGGGTSSGSTSRVRTDHLEMELDPASGSMRGRVLKGVFAGREIEAMAPAELALLWRDCQFADPSSAQLIEAYLDRLHPSWKEDMARAESEPGPGGVMTVEEAYGILGLSPGATEEEIRRAHRSLMLKMHPDRGGSTYLAAKINEAKDVLLAGRRS